MRLHLFLALAFLASAISGCHSLDAEDELPAEELFTPDASDLEDEYIVETLKNISRNLKDKVIALVDRVVKTGSEIKDVSKKGGEDVKGHLKELWRELARSRDQLKTKLGELFNPPQYSGETRLQEKLQPFRSIREKLQRALAQLKERYADKLERLRGILRDIYGELKAKLVQYRKSGPAQYSEDVSSAETPYIIKTLKELHATVKSKLGELFDKIKATAAQVKVTYGAKAQELKEELKALREQLAATRNDVRDKVSEIFKPSQYAIGDHVQETLRPLHQLFDKFIKESKEVTEENVEHLKFKLRELQWEIRRAIWALRRRRPALYTEFEDDKTQDVQAYDDASSILHNELLDITAKLEGLEESETPDPEAIDEQLRRLADIETKLNAIQQRSEPARYFLEPALKRINDLFTNSTVKLQQVVDKLKKAADVLADGARRATKHVKHSFGKIKTIIVKGRDEIHQKIRDSLNSQDDAASEDAGGITTTGGIDESYGTTPYPPYVTTKADETYTTAVQDLPSPTEDDYPHFGEPIEFEEP